MRVPRHLKHPVALWLIDGRNALDPALKPIDVARELGVDETTVRRWESARAGSTKNLPSPEHVEALEAILGTASPERAAPALEASVLEAVNRQTRLLETFISEQRDQYGGGSATMPAADPVTVRRRRAYWIQQARQRLAPKGKKVMSFGEIADRMGLEGNTRDLVPLWASGAADPDPGYFERLARALHIPERDILSPPMTDEERLDRWAREFVEVEQPPAPGERRQRRAS